MSIGQRELVYQLAKFDDDIFITQGFRKEQIDKAIEKYGLDKEPGPPTTSQEDERLADFAASRGGFQKPAIPSPSQEGSRATGKTISLD